MGNMRRVVDLTTSKELDTEVHDVLLSNKGFGIDISKERTLEPGT